MALYIHDRNPNSNEIKEILSQTPKCPGTCLFIDIVNSTEIKYQTGIAEWGQKINNTFNFLSLLNEFPDNIVKGIGDEIMLYIPDDELRAKTGYNNYIGLLSELYSTLYNIKYFPNNKMFLECKMGIHYCTEAYNITFLEGANDFYGSDIDLSARLMSKAIANRIVISEDFYNKVTSDVSGNPQNEKDPAFKLISSKYLEDFKGIPNSIEYRVINV